MIERVRIENFRALRNVDVRLKPLTVLIGPNDTGKSSFLDALHTYDSGFQRSDRWRLQDPPNVEVFHAGQEAAESAVQSWLFRLAPTGATTESKGRPDLGLGAPWIEDNGSNVAAYLDFLLRKDRRCFDRINEELREHIPGFEDLNISTPEPHLRRIVLSIERGLERAASDDLRRDRRAARSGALRARPRNRPVGLRHGRAGGARSTRRLAAARLTHAGVPPRCR